MNIRLLITLFVFINPLLFCQWVQQNSGVTAGFRGVQFININTGWICGNGGIILKTTNGGLNWLQQNSGVANSLTDIQPVDSDVIYCVGIFETILKSTNGGTNWIVIRANVDPGKFFHSVSFINRNQGWICGSGQWVLKTTDGGLTFDSVMIGTPFTWDVYFKDNVNGLIAGEVGTMFKTTNGGNNWNLINMLGEAGEFFELSFIGDVGWTVGLQTRQVYKTTNFGASWDSSGSINGTNSWLGTIFFSSLNTGWICGDSGKIYKSTNGGTNWHRQTVPITVGYGPSYFVNDSVGWVVGSIGTIIHTTTGGQIVNVSMQQTEYTKEYYFLQNYPNPFNPKTTISFEIPYKTKVIIKIYNSLGEVLDKLIEDDLTHGRYSLEWDASNYPSGIYFYKITANNFTETKKMILLK